MYLEESPTEGAQRHSNLMYAWDIFSICRRVRRVAIERQYRCP